MKHLRTIVAAITIFPVHPLSASAFTSIGYGLQTCGWWTAQRKEPAPAVQANYAGQWVLGFLTGIADVTTKLKLVAPKTAGMPYDPLARLDDHAVFAWIDNECHHHPLQNLQVTSETFAAAHPR